MPGHGPALAPNPAPGAGESSRRKMMTMNKIGTIRKMTLAPYIDYLTDRLKHEEKGYVRRYIRGKIRHVTGKLGPSTRPER